MTDPIWAPCAAMVGLTAVVWVKLYADRLGEMRARGIDPQSIATARTAADQLARTQAADNFRNLFEVPVLFYVLCVALVLNGGSTPGFVAAAWAYVALRVVHRFLVYVASTLLLFGMWILFVVRIVA